MLRSLASSHATCVRLFTFPKRSFRVVSELQDRQRIRHTSHPGRQTHSRKSVKTLLLLEERDLVGIIRLKRIFIQLNKALPQNAKTNRNKQTNSCKPPTTRLRSSLLIRPAASLSLLERKSATHIYLPGLWTI